MVSGPAGWDQGVRQEDERVYSQYRLDEGTVAAAWSRSCPRTESYLLRRREFGAWRQAGSEPPTPIRTRAADSSQFGVVASKDHAGPLVNAMLARLTNPQLRSMGSSLKFCLVAEGKADIYLRDLPTMEWDTAAAQCIVEAAGGGVYSLNGELLPYGKPGLKNPAIITVGDTSFDWRLLVSNCELFYESLFRMNVLIIKLGATGDVVRTTPLLRRLSGSVTWITSAKNGVLLEGLADNLRHFSWEARARALDISYDLAINLEDTSRSLYF